MENSVDIELEMGIITVHDGFDPKDMIWISMAVSLKRIADAMEKINEEV